jgi:hypothetical protein
MKENLMLSLLQHSTVKCCRPAAASQNPVLPAAWKRRVLNSVVLIQDLDRYTPISYAVSLLYTKSAEFYGSDLALSQVQPISFVASCLDIKDCRILFALDPGLSVPISSFTS